MIKTYSPKVDVRLIKTARRSQLATGLQAAGRYQEFESIDITPYLVTGEPITVQRRMGSAGSWNLSLADKPIPAYGESLAYMVEPNDIVEIRAARSPHEYKSGKMPVIMRGFVSSIDRSRANAGGQLHRRVHLAGADYSKILDIIRIYYLNNSAIGDNILGELAFFQKYASLGDAKIMSAKEFATLVLEKIINPFIARLTRNSSGQKVGAAVIAQLGADVSIEGSVSPLAVSLFNDGSVRQFLSQFLDIGVFNEMFVEDWDDASKLVIRPNRFLNVNDDPIQGGDTVRQALIDSIVNVPDPEILSITEGRSDAGVANYFWVNNFGWQVRDSIEVSQLAATSDPSQYAVIDYVNSNAARFGFRKMEVSSALGAPEQDYSDAPKANQASSETDRLLAWLTERRRILAEQNKDNSILEDGVINMAGNERVTIGGYVRAAFGAVEPALYYVAGLTHTIVPNGQFMTNVAFERGTGFAVRARRADGGYHAERNLKGLL